MSDSSFELIKDDLRKVLDIVQGLDKKFSIQDEKLKNIKEVVDKNEEFILGNGGNGAKVRLDRLERMNKVMSKISWIAVAGIIGILIKLIIRG